MNGFVDRDNGVWTRGDEPGSVDRGGLWRLKNDRLEWKDDGLWVPVDETYFSRIAPCARAAIAALWPEPLHAPESREIVQISPFKDTISALCADGTIWVFNSSRYPEGEWVSLPRIPDL